MARAPLCHFRVGFYLHNTSHICCPSRTCFILCTHLLFFSALGIHTLLVSSLCTTSSLPTLSTSTLSTINNHLARGVLLKAQTCHQAYDRRSLYLQQDRGAGKPARVDDWEFATHATCGQRVLSHPVRSSPSHSVSFSVSFASASHLSRTREVELYTRSLTTFPSPPTRLWRRVDDRLSIPERVSITHARSDQHLRSSTYQ